MCRSEAKNGCRLRFIQPPQVISYSGKQQLIQHTEILSSKPPILRFQPIHLIIQPIEPHWSTMVIGLLYPPKS